jgi:hypothetical protein
MKLSLSLAVIGALGALGIAKLQGPLAAQAHDVKQREDVVLVPHPRELKLVSLGYDAAMVDYLWGKLLVEYGTHVSEKRGFDVPRYIDAILTLEPDYRPMFRFVDTLLVYRPPQGTAEDAYMARKYLEQGIQTRPYDHEVWMHYGQFIAFLSPSFIKDPEVNETWREEGARAIAHAVELGADTDRTQTAASILSRYGDKDATIKHLRKAYALTDDEQGKAWILAKLSQMEASSVRDEAESTQKAFDAERSKRAPFLKPQEFRILGPFIDPSACAGIEASLSSQCASTWDEAHKRRERERGQ